METQNRLRLPPEILYAICLQVSIRYIDDLIAGPLALQPPTTADPESNAQLPLLQDAELAALKAAMGENDISLKSANPIAALLRSSLPLRNVTLKVLSDVLDIAMEGPEDGIRRLAAKPMARIQPLRLLWAHPDLLWAAVKRREIQTQMPPLLAAYLLMILMRGVRLCGESILANERREPIFHDLAVLTGQIISSVEERGDVDDSMFEISGPQVHDTALNTINVSLKLYFFFLKGVLDKDGFDDILQVPIPMDPAEDPREVIDALQEFSPEQCPTMTTFILYLLHKIRFMLQEREELLIDMPEVPLAIHNAVEALGVLDRLEATSFGTPDDRRLLDDIRAHISRHLPTTSRDTSVDACADVAGIRIAGN